MSKVNTKDSGTKKELLGQYFTPQEVVNYCLQKIDFSHFDLVFEPSCGDGAFLNVPNKVIALEVDDSVIRHDFVKNVNFYDYQEKLTGRVCFLGNPPFRTPAISLSNNQTYNREKKVRELTDKYDITGMREEAAFFIVKTIDLILTNNIEGHIYYILPKAIFQNNSRSYQSFFSFLRKNAALLEVFDLPNAFDKVTQPLVFAHWSVNCKDKDQVDFYVCSIIRINIKTIFIFVINEDYLVFGASSPNTVTYIFPSNRII